MTQEDKQLLLNDLCARLPYGVKVDHFLDLLRIEKDGVTKELLGVIPSSENVMVGYDINNYEDSVIEDIKPYLRPMSSMTEEENEELKYEIELELQALEGEGGHNTVSASPAAFEIDFYNKRHIDYRGLIEKGLALEAPEGMYNV